MIRTKLVVLLAIGSLLLLSHISHYYPYSPDDTFIALQYARRLITGRGLTWNDGEYVEGYSDLLWILMTALLGYLGVDLLVAVQLMGVACTLLTQLLFVFYARRFGLSFLSLSIGIFIFAFTMPVAMWGAAGLEAPMVMFLLGWTLYYSRKLIENNDTPSSVRIGCLLGLICWLRPEGPIFALIIAINLFVAKCSWRKILVLGSVSFAFFCALLIFRLCYYGTWVSNTVLAKLAFNSTRISDGFVYSYHSLIPFLPLFFLVFLGLRLRPLPVVSGRSRFIQFLLLSGLMLTIVITAAGGDWMPGARMFVPLTPILILLVMESSRYFMIEKNTWTLLVAATLILYGSIQVFQWPCGWRRQVRFWADAIARPIGIGLGERYGADQPLIAVFNAGAIPYYAKLRTLDAYGLNDAYLTQHRYEHKTFGQGVIGHDLFDADYIERRKPDLLVFDIVGIPDQCAGRLKECQKLFANYTPVFLTISGFPVKIWRRNDSTRIRP